MISTYLFIASAAVAILLFWLVRRERFLRFGILLTYAVWHMPIVLTSVLPFETGRNFPQDLATRVTLLGLIHLIMVSGVIAARTARKKAMPMKFEYSFDAPMIGVAYTAAAFMVIEVFVLKGVHFSLDLATNRAEFSDTQTSLIGQIAIVLAGAALYLLTARPVNLRTALKYYPPFLTITITSLAMGNRQFMLLGIIVWTLTVVDDRKIRFTRLAVIGGSAAIVFAVLMAGFGAIRAKEARGVHDYGLQALADIRVKDYSSPLARDYTVRTAGLYLFVYYGMEYETAAALFANVHARAPFTSLTCPLFYRRISGPFGLPDQQYVATSMGQEIEAATGGFSNVWRTMFAHPYLEGGWPAVFTLAVLLTLLNFLLTRRFVARRTNGSLAALVIFYTFVIFGVMYIPTREAPMIGLLLTSVMAALIGLARPSESRLVPRSPWTGSAEIGPQGRRALSP